MSGTIISFLKFKNISCLFISRSKSQFKHQMRAVGSVVASLRAFIHFSAKLSLSAQNTIPSMAGWVSWNTRPGDIPSYSSKFF